MADDMTHVVRPPWNGREFDPFLCAAIGEDPNGKLLSVLSALARMDVDPWVEAELLARMPRENATVRLTELIAALPNAPHADIPANRIAGDLVALLPQPRGFNPPPQDKLAEIFSSATSGFGIGFSAIAFLIAMVFLIWINPSPRSEPSAAPAASSEKTSTRLSPPGSEP
jgi:hypothetical protein